MKTITVLASLALTFALSVSCGETSARANDQSASGCTTITLSQCYQLPTYTPAPLPRVPSYYGNVMYYDYAYRMTENLIVVCKGQGGASPYSREYTRTENRVQHFEMPESQGEDIALIRQIKQFITTQSAFACQ